MHRRKQQAVDRRCACIPAREPSQNNQEDCNYEWHSTCNLFIAFEPARGRRVVTVTDRCTKCDWAGYVKKIVDEMYPQAECVTLVCDQ